jgi:hypothetical protein
MGHATVAKISRAPEKPDRSKLANKSTEVPMLTQLRKISFSFVCNPSE